MVQCPTLCTMFAHCFEKRCRPVAIVIENQSSYLKSRLKSSVNQRHFIVIWSATTFSNRFIMEAKRVVLDLCKRLSSKRAPTESEYLTVTKVCNINPRTNVLLIANQHSRHWEEVLQTVVKRCILLELSISADIFNEVFMTGSALVRIAPKLNRLLKLEPNNLEVGDQVVVAVVRHARELASLVLRTLCPLFQVKSSSRSKVHWQSPKTSRTWLN